MPSISIFPATRSSTEAPIETECISPWRYCYESAVDLVSAIVRVTSLFYKTIIFRSIYFLSSRFIDYKSWILFSLSADFYEDMKELFARYMECEYPDLGEQIRERIPILHHRPARFHSFHFSDEMSKAIRKVNEKIIEWNDVIGRIPTISDQLKNAIDLHNDYHAENEQAKNISQIRKLIEQLQDSLKAANEIQSDLKGLLSESPLENIDETLEKLEQPSRLSKKISLFCPIKDPDFSLSFPPISDHSPQPIPLIGRWLGGNTEGTENRHSSQSPAEEMQKNLEQLTSLKPISVKNQSMLSEKILSWNELIKNANEQVTTVAELFPLDEAQSNEQGYAYLAYPATSQPSKLPKNDQWILLIPSTRPNRGENDPLNFNELLEDSLHFLVESAEKNVLIVDTGKVYQDGIDLDQYLTLLEEELQATKITIVGIELGGILAGELIKNHAFKNDEIEYEVMRSRIWASTSALLQEKFERTLERMRWHPPHWITSLVNDYIEMVVQHTDCDMDVLSTSQKLAEYNIEDFYFDKKIEMEGSSEFAPSSIMHALETLQEHPSSLRAYELTTDFYPEILQEMAEKIASSTESDQPSSG